MVTQHLSVVNEAITPGDVRDYVSGGIRVLPVVMQQP